MLMMISGLLICCSLLRTVILTPMTCSENLSCPEPKIRGSLTSETAWSCRIIQLDLSEYAVGVLGPFLQYMQTAGA